MVCMFHCANSHLEMQLNDIKVVSFMVSAAYTITDTDLIPPKMADTNISIWYQCISITWNHSDYLLILHSVWITSAAYATAVLNGVLNGFAHVATYILKLFMATHSNQYCGILYFKVHIIS